MRIYRLYCADLFEGHCYQWARSLREVAVRRREMKGDGFSVHSIDALDFPSKKGDVVGWLNKNFTRDNG